MTKIKLCGLTRPCEIEAANRLHPEYIGFVFAPKSRRYISFEKAAELRAMLSLEIQAVGVFVNEKEEIVGELLNRGVIDLAQLHGEEEEGYIKRLRALTEKPLIKAFRMNSGWEVSKAEMCSAEYLLFDSGAGTGTVFDWEAVRHIRRPFFLAGGLSMENVGDAVRFLHPYGVDVSSGIETDGKKDTEKMAAFVRTARKEEKI